MRSATVRQTPQQSWVPERRATSRAAHPVLDAVYLLNCLAIGGSERKIVRLVNQLWRRGVRAGIAYLNGPDTLLPLVDACVPHWHLERRGKFSPTATRRLAEIMVRTHCRTLFAVNSYPCLYALATRALLGRRAPRLIGLVNTTDFGAGQRWRQALYSRVLRRFDVVVYGCEAQRRSWEGAAATGNSIVIYNGVDLSEFSGSVARESAQSLRLELGLTQASFIVGSVGRLVAAKNHRVLIDAVAVLRERGIDARLLLVGEGELRTELEHHAVAAGVRDSIVFTGALTDLRPALALMDVFVLPSLYVETFSNAALEAMAMGKAVILSDIGGAAEMVRDGIEGRLIARARLATELPVMLATLARERQSLVQLGLAARRRVEAQFSLDDMVSRYEQLIGEAPDGDDRT